VKKRTTRTAWGLSAVLAVALLGGAGVLGVRYRCRLGLFPNRQWYFGEIEEWEIEEGASTGVSSASASAGKLVGHGLCWVLSCLSGAEQATPWSGGFDPLKRGAILER
jgi:hypothetical protein